MNAAKQAPGLMPSARNLVTFLPMAAACTGCTHSPTISVFGSFFPTWLLFALLGVIFAFVVRGVCVRQRWDTALPLPVLFYLACAAAFTFASYLVWLA